MKECRIRVALLSASAIFFFSHSRLQCQLSEQQRAQNSLRIIELLIDFTETTYKRGIFIGRCSERVREIDTEFRNYGFTAQEYLNVFCTAGRLPEDPFGFLAVHLARGPNISCEQELWDIDQKVRESQVAYLSYVEKQYHEIKLLYVQGIDYDVCNQDGNNLLIVGAAAGCTSLVEEVLNSSSNIDINAKNTAGWNALSLAVVLGKSDLVALLLQHGANPLIKCNETPLIEIICACDYWPNREVRKRKIAEILTHALCYGSFGNVGPGSSSS